MCSMPSSSERTPHERETLIFPTLQEAQVWRERVGEQLQSETPGVNAGRQVVGQAVAQQFESHGEGVATFREPWEHSSAEHEEAQRLVDVAFTKDLGTALRQAKQSSHYPRNLDLLHDLLTGELYDHVRQSNLNKQSLSLWVTETVIIALLALLGILLLMFAIS